MSNRTTGADCLCQPGYFSHTALRSPAPSNPAGEPLHQCDRCDGLGKSGSEPYAECRGFDETSSSTGELYAPVARTGFYGVRWAGAGRLRYTFHDCAPSARCLPVVGEVLSNNETSHAFTSLEGLATEHNSISNCAPTLRGFLCAQCDEQHFRWLESESRCHRCPLQREGAEAALGTLISLALLQFAFVYFIFIVRYLLQLVPSLYSILPFLQELTLVDGMSFDWPLVLDPAFLAPDDLFLVFRECVDGGRRGPVPI